MSFRNITSTTTNNSEYQRVVRRSAMDRVKKDRHTVESLRKSSNRLGSTVIAAGVTIEAVTSGFMGNGSGNVITNSGSMATGLSLIMYGINKLQSANNASSRAAALKAVEYQIELDLNLAQLKVPMQGGPVLQPLSVELDQ